MQWPRRQLHVKRWRRMPTARLYSSVSKSVSGVWADGGNLWEICGACGTYRTSSKRKTYLLGVRIIWVYSKVNQRAYLGDSEDLYIPDFPLELCPFHHPFFGQLVTVKDQNTSDDFL